MEDIIFIGILCLIPVLGLLLPKVPGLLESKSPLYADITPRGSIMAYPYQTNPEPSTLAKIIRLLEVIGIIIAALVSGLSAYQSNGAKRAAESAEVKASSAEIKANDNGEKLDKVDTQLKAAASVMGRKE